MATFYFNGAADIAAELLTDWQTLGNWWMDSDHTVAATALPTSSDSVIASATIDTNSGSEPTVVNLTMQSDRVFGIPITVTGVATFNANALNNGTITGDCTFSGSQSRNMGAITGDCTFSGGSYNGGTITGDCTFNNGSYIDYGTVNGDCTFNGSSIEYGTVNGNCTFNSGSIIRNSGNVNGDCVFTGGSLNWGAVSGHGEFNDTCANGESGFSASINCGTATFNDNSVNYAIVYGDATFRDGSRHESTLAIVYGHATFNDSSRTVDAAGQPYLGDATFNDNSRLSGCGASNATFNDNSRMEQGPGGYYATVAGTATFRDNSANTVGCYGQVIVQHGGGINGSSILGLV